MYKVEHNKGNISIEQLHDQWTINGNIADTIKVKHTNKDELTIFKDGNEYIVRIHSMDTNEKELTLLINGKRQQYRVKEPVDLFLSQLGIDTFAKKVIKNIKAPMPGLVLKILVSKRLTPRKRI